MQLKFDISFVIYGYLFICLVLMVFNILYIFYSSGLKKRIAKNAIHWEKEIKEQITYLQKGKEIEQSHMDSVLKKMKNTNQMVAYVRALELVKESNIDTREYSSALYLQVQGLAHAYAKKEKADKAFFAYFVAENPPCRGEDYRPLMEILISYLEDSTIYCRENVLKAFYAMGNTQAVETTIDWMEARGMFHHQKLLADGLMTFQGDKALLANRLWDKRWQYSTTTNVAVIQFISAKMDGYEEAFYEELKRTDVDIEIRIAMLRYFQRHYYAPIKGLLNEVVNTPEMADENLLIVATSVLGKYPGEDTKEALKKALRHRNWYVRKNAAASLVNITEDEKEYESILKGKDRYAREILEYTLEEMEKGGR